MTISDEKKLGEKSASSAKTMPVPPAATVYADDVERVLEHVSSPFRWELLDERPDLPEIAAARKIVQNKQHTS